MGNHAVSALQQHVVENMILTVVQNEPTVTKERLAAIIEQFAPAAGWGSPEQKRQLQVSLEAKLTIHMTLGAVVKTEYEPWLAARQSSIDPFFWERYRQYLLGEGYSPSVVSRLGDVSDRVLGLLEDPKKPGSWYRRGLVVGHVQSGKTANYLGLINKAADAGYKLIILIAGTMNNLRRQTQERVDEGFVGRDSSKILRAKGQNIPVGVGIRGPGRHPVVFTSTEKDFNLNTAQSLGLSLKAVTEPVILVIKKNDKTLANLAEWLKRHNAGGSEVITDIPMLLIDDEADNASVNTAGSGADPKTINRLIRGLLKLFEKRCYVGYTATPFANIFIDPDSEHSMLGDDLFPQDFIYSLDPPSNYFGPDRIFQDPAELDVTREVEDYESFLPLKHRKEARPDELPESLKHAVRLFVLAHAIRLVRGQERKHNSMLINVSRFTDVQMRVRDLVSEYLGHLKRSIQYNYKLPWVRAQSEPLMAALHASWEREFRSACEWETVRARLHDAAAPVIVEAVNMKTGSSALDYKKHREHGLNVIAVGGLSLSRGFTLEGLSISYVLRNSQMYDTLLQMGRWFGYRDGYTDVCRILMPEEALGWYAHITEAVAELRSELRRMEDAGLTPKEFGLKVRAHPDSLIVTARNKMRTAETVFWEVELGGKLIETAKLHGDADKIGRNREALADVITRIQKVAPRSAPDKGNWIWQGIPREEVCTFLGRFENHPASMKTDRNAVLKYCSDKRYTELDLWDVVLVSNQDVAPKDRTPVGPVSVGAQVRKTLRERLSPPALLVSGKKARVAGRGLEREGLGPDELRKAEAAYKHEFPKGTNIADHFYRRFRARPLLMLHLLKLEGEADTLAAAYGISFPEPPPGRERTLVKYEVGIIWWREQYGEDVEEFEEELEAATGV